MQYYSLLKKVIETRTESKKITEKPRHMLLLGWLVKTENIQRLDGSSVS